jgi:Spy/CpxP family protein refolding chaperone
MKRILLLLAVVAVLGTLGYCAAVRWITFHRPPAGMSRTHDIAWLKRELRLDATQTQALQKSSREYQARLDALCAAHCAARFALGEALAKPRVDEVAARACVAKMSQAAAEAEQATLAHILEVRALLTGEQTQRYSALIRDQVCSMPMGAP